MRFQLWAWTKRTLAWGRQNRWVRRTAVALVVVFTVYMLFCNYNEPTEVGIARNMISGEMWLQDSGGLYVTPPWVWVATIDTRPVRVAVTSGGRGYSGKLVQFDKRYWREFVQVEGWRYYWWSNRISINFGYDEEYRGVKDILRGHTFGAKHYNFVVVLEEYQSKQ